MAYGLLLLRVIAGLTMSAHGAQKLFGWFGGPGPNGMAGAFRNFGFRKPLLLAFGVGLAESSGLLFAAGLLTPLAALCIAVVMMNAIVIVHLPKGFFNQDGGYEFPLMMLTVALAVTATGPGRLSVDRAIGWDDNITGIWWAVGVAVAAGVITLAVQTIARRRERLRAAAA